MLNAVNTANRNLSLFNTYILYRWFGLILPLAINGGINFEEINAGSKLT